jgi:hypothetical protein
LAAGDKDFIKMFSEKQHHGFSILKKCRQYLKRNFVFKSDGELTEPVGSDLPGNCRGSGCKG